MAANFLEIQEEQGGCKYLYVRKRVAGKLTSVYGDACPDELYQLHDQAVLEEVAASFLQTEEIIENGIVNGVSATDVQKILNLKHAWELVSLWEKP